LTCLGGYVVVPDTRLTKELESYNKELVAQQAKVDAMKARNEDIHEIRQQVRRPPAMHGVSAPFPDSSPASWRLPPDWLRSGCCKRRWTSFRTPGAAWTRPPSCSSSLSSSWNKCRAAPARWGGPSFSRRPPRRAPDLRNLRASVHRCILVFYICGRGGVRQCTRAITLHHACDFQSAYQYTRKRDGGKKHILTRMHACNYEDS